MIVLALLDLPEDIAADEIFRAVGDDIPVRRRLRHATQRIIATRPTVVRVRFATLARQDREEMERRMRHSGEP